MSGIGRGLGTQELMLIEQRVTNETPSTGTAYLFWLFLGFFAAHRFYLGRPLSAITQVILNFCVIGLLWTFADLFLIPGIIRANQAATRDRLIRQIACGGGFA